MSSASSASGDDDRPKKVQRGPTKLPSLVQARSQGTRVDVRMDALGAPIGDKARVFANYLGVQSRSVSLLYASWHEVPRNLKDQMWKDVIVSFLIINLQRNL